MSNYGMKIYWSDEDQCWIAQSSAFPLTMAHGDTPQEAAEMMHEAIQLTVETHIDEGWPLPKAEKVVAASGQFRLRIPRTLHARLIEAAKDDGVSLNQLCATELASSAERIGSVRKMESICRRFEDVTKVQVHQLRQHIQVLDRLQWVEVAESPGTGSNFVTPRRKARTVAAELPS